MRKVRKHFNVPQRSRAIPVKCYRSHNKGGGAFAATTKHPQQRHRCAFVVAAVTLQ